MKRKNKFLAPMYGLRNRLKEPIKLDKDLILRSVNLFEDEHKLFKAFGLNGTYEGVLEIDYEYDENNPSEPFPGLFVNLINKFDASLVVYGDGIVGVAGVFPAAKESFPGGGILISSKKTQFAERLDKK